MEPNFTSIETVQIPSLFNLSDSATIGNSTLSIFEPDSNNTFQEIFDLNPNKTLQGIFDLDLNKTISKITSPRIPPKRVYNDYIELFCEAALELEPTTFHYAICGILQFFIHCIGIIGNFLTLVVLHSPDSITPFYTFLRGLILSNLFVLLINGIGFILPQFFRCFGVAHTFSYFTAPRLGPYFYSLLSIGHTSVVYFTAFLMLDRYVVICRPLQQRRLCSLRRAYQISIGIVIFSIVINFPRHMEFAVLPWTMSDGTEILKLIPTQLLRNNAYRKHYYFTTWFMTRCIIPYTPMLIGLGGVIMESYKSFIKMEVISTAKRHETTLGYITISITLLYVLCSIPTTCRLVIRGFYKIYPDPPLYYAATILQYLNMSFHCIILCIIKDRFRSHFFQLLTLPYSALVEVKGWFIQRGQILNWKRQKPRDILDQEYSDGEFEEYDIDLESPIIELAENQINEEIETDVSKSEETQSCWKWK